jgi:hypothetical protein
LTLPIWPGVASGTKVKPLPETNTTTAKDA